MRPLLVALLLGLLPMAEARADGTPYTCQQMLDMIEARLKTVRMTKPAYEKIKALEAKGRKAMATGGDCASPLRQALRKLGLHQMPH